MYIFDLIGDKRVEGLSTHLQLLCPGLRHAQAVEYGRLEGISGAIKFLIDPHVNPVPPNAVIVMAGLYEILNIKTVPVTTVTLRHLHSEYAPKLINGMFEALVESAFIVNPKVKVINCTIYDADINKMINPNATSKHQHQDVASGFIRQINQNLLDLNARFGVHTPYTDRVTHRYHPKGGHSHVYDDLLQGYLPSVAAHKKCARLIASSLLKDSANW